MPSAIAFEISIFPHNVPLPTPKTSAWLVGGTLHLVHFCVRTAQLRTVPEADLGWEDMYREDNNVSWFDWVTFLRHLTRCAPACSCVLSYDRPCR